MLESTDGIHDLGGMHGFGSAVWPGSEVPYHERWEQRVFAAWVVIGAERLGSGSGRAIREEMAPEDYLRASYYERWLWSNERRLQRGGVIVAGELDAWVERLRGGESPPRRDDPDQAGRVVSWVERTRELGQAEQPRFAPGERVRVRRMRPEGHTRCPRYVRGAAGVVEHVRGADTFPDIGPYQGPAEPVYAVAFASTELFGASEDGAWTVALDLYESYLDPA